MTVRWTFDDPTVPESFTVPINPNEMGSPHQVRDIAMAAGSLGGLNRIRIVDKVPQVPKEWAFGGVIRTKEHHDELLRWTKKKHPIHVSDHLGRTFEVIIKNFEPVDRTPTPNVPWRLRFTLTTFLLKEIT